jgi:hypothetical protein
VSRFRSCFADSLDDPAAQLTSETGSISTQNTSNRDNEVILVLSDEDIAPLRLVLARARNEYYNEEENNRVGTGTLEGVYLMRNRDGTKHQPSPRACFDFDLAHHGLSRGVCSGRYVRYVDLLGIVYP